MRVPYCSKYNLGRRSCQWLRFGSRQPRHLGKHFRVAHFLLLIAAACKLHGACFFWTGCQLVPGVYRPASRSTPSVARPSLADFLMGAFQDGDKKEEEKVNMKEEDNEEDKEKDKKRDDKEEGDAEKQQEAVGKDQDTDDDTSVEAASLNPASQVSKTSPLSIEDVKEGMVLDGTVIRNRLTNVFVDIGCGEDVYMDIPARVARREKVSKLGIGAKHVLLVRNVKKVGNKTKVYVVLNSSEEVLKMWEDERVPLEDIKGGARTSGRIHEIRDNSTRIDIGCKKMAILKVNQDVRSKLQIGDFLSEVIVEEANVTNRMLVVTSKEAESLVVGRQPRSRVPKKPSAPPSKKKGAKSPTTADPELKLSVTTTTISSTSSKTSGKRSKGKTAPLMLTVSVAADVDVKQDLKLNVELQGLRILSANKKEGSILFAVEEPLAPSEDDNDSGDDAKLKAARSKTTPKEKQTVSESGKKSKLRQLSADNLPKVGASFEGTVHVNNKFGTYVDIGRVDDARLNYTNKAVGAKMRFGEKVQVVVQRIVEENNRVVVELVNEQYFVDRKDSRIAIDSLEVGGRIDGYVKDKSKRGTYLDIGCEIDAKLNISATDAKELALGQLLLNLHIDKITREPDRITVSLSEV